MSAVDLDKLKKVARWVIDENARGVSAVPKYIAQMAKDAVGDTSPMKPYAHRVRFHKLKDDGTSNLEELFPTITFTPKEGT